LAIALQTIYALNICPKRQQALDESGLPSAAHERWALHVLDPSLPSLLDIALLLCNV